MTLGLLLCVRQLDAKHLAAAALRAQAGHEPRIVNRVVFGVAGSTHTDCCR